MLTPRQKETLDFIVRYQRENGGVSPCLTEIGAALKIASKGPVHRLLTQLEVRGFIVRAKCKQRWIEVLSVPEKPAPKRIPIYDARTLKLRGYLPQ